MASTGADVLGVDTDTSIEETYERFHNNHALQGNLNPETLLGEWADIEKEAKKILSWAEGRSGYIFNLGHGIIKETNPENVGRLVELVHQYKSS